MIFNRFAACWRALLSLVLVLSTCLPAAAVNVLDVELKGDGQNDDTASLLAAMGVGGRELYFPAGTYRLGSLKVPAETTLQFSPQARVLIEPTGIEVLADVVPKTELRPWLTLVGDGITIGGLNTTGLFEAKLTRSKKIDGDTARKRKHWEVRTLGFD